MNCWLVIPSPQRPTTINQGQPRSLHRRFPHLGMTWTRAGRRAVQGGAVFRSVAGAKMQISSWVTPLVGWLSCQNHPQIDAAKPGICLKNLLITSRSGMFPFIFRSLREILVVIDTLKMSSFARGGSSRVAAMQTTPNVVVAYCIEMCFSEIMLPSMLGYPYPPYHH